MALKRKNSVRPNTLINEKIKGQISYFSYLVYYVRFKSDIGTEKKLILDSKPFVKYLGGLSEEKLMKSYDVKAVHTLICGSESWITKRRNVTADIKSLACARGHI